MQEEIKNKLVSELDSYYIHYLCYCDTLRAYELIEKEAFFEDNKALKEVVIGALTDCFLINIARLLDKSYDSMNIFTWIDRIKKNVCHFDNKEEVYSKIELFQQKISGQDFKEFVDKIRLLRDKQLAHNDKKYFHVLQLDGVGIPFYKHPVMGSVIKTILEESYSLFGATPKFNPLLEGQGADITDLFISFRATGGNKEQKY